MKRTKIVSMESAKIRGIDSWIDLYYSIEEDAVYTTGGNGRYFITTLIRKNTPQEIEKTVDHIMAL